LSTAFQTNRDPWWSVAGADPGSQAVRVQEARQIALGHEIRRGRQTIRRQIEAFTVSDLVGSMLHERVAIDRRILPLMFGSSSTNSISLDICRRGNPLAMFLQLETQRITRA